MTVGALLPSNWLDRPLAEIAQLAPIQPLTWALAARHGVEMWIKREDLLDPWLGGNKLYKLYHHLQAARQQNAQCLYTCGGAYSNHVYAFGRAVQQLGCKGVAVVRGDLGMPLSPTLRDVQAMGVELHIVTREVYRQRDEPNFWAPILQQFGPGYCIPEGGSGVLGALGMRDFAFSLHQCLWPSAGGQTASRRLPVDILALPCGTGASLAGVVAANVGPQVLGVCALKLGNQVGAYRASVSALVTAQAATQTQDWRLETEFHAGGYARYPPYLASFVADFEAETQIRLDPVYGAKLFYALAHNIQHQWPKGTRVLVIHTGGLQGKRGFPLAESASPASRGAADHAASRSRHFLVEP